MFGPSPLHSPKILNLKFNQLYALNRGLFCEKNMSIQTANLGTAPSGAGGDTFRTAAAKFNENFTNNAHAASRLVGTQAGNVMEVGAFGLGGGDSISDNPDTFKKRLMTGVYIANDPAHNTIRAYLNLAYSQDWIFQIRSEISGDPEFRFFTKGTTWGSWIKFRTELNTTVDANGFIKAASPIVQLFADKIELNDEAQQQNIEFEKLGVGDYLIKGSSGFAQEGWYIETPKDANGNLLVAVVYEQLENGDISVKTYDYMLNKKGRIVVDTETPLDIPEARWIDLRLQELPQPEIEMPESVTPPEFQPTGLAEAVATVMESYDDTEQ